MTEGGFALPLPAELIDALGDRVAERVLERMSDRSSPWLTVDDAASYTGLSKDALYKLTAAKAIPHAKPGKRLLFKREELDAWLDGHREGPGAGDLRALPAPWRKAAG